MRTEPFTEDQLRSLSQTLNPIERMVIDLHDVDIDAGRGILEGSDRCIWTRRGHRITVAILPGGGYMLSQSKKPDPEYPGKACK